MKRTGLEQQYFGRLLRSASAKSAVTGKVHVVDCRNHTPTRGSQDYGQGYCPNSCVSVFDKVIMEYEILYYNCWIAYRFSS